MPSKKRASDKGKKVNTKKPVPKPLKVPEPEAPEVLIEVAQPPDLPRYVEPEPMFTVPAAPEPAPEGWLEEAIRRLQAGLNAGPTMAVRDEVAAALRLLRQARGN